MGLRRQIHAAGIINGTTLAVTHLAGCAVTVVRVVAGEYTLTLDQPIDHLDRQVEAWVFTADNAWFGCTVGGTADNTFTVRFFTFDPGGASPASVALTNGTFYYRVSRMD